MEKENALILTFNQINKNDVPLVGGKGASLGDMYNSGFPVPPGFCVSAKAYEKFIEETGIRDEIKEILENLDVDDNRALQSAAKQVRTIIRTEKIPDDIASEIINFYEKMYKSKYEVPESVGSLVNSSRIPPFVAVRSSATAEDLPEASFAGQQSTYLNVKGEEELLEAVKNCWASLFTARAVFYREKNNFEHFKVSICVIVQRMVDSTKSGVSFSVDPISEDENKVIIEAGWGLGEAIVSGIVNPDHYVVDKSTWEIIEKKVHKQNIYITRDIYTGKNKKLELDEPKRSSQVLEDDEIIQLAKITDSIEKHYQFPQDVEWAVEGRKLFIVQSRPITTLKKERAEAPKITEAGEPILTGLPASHGVVSSRVKTVSNIEELDKIEKGDILVTKMTDPDFVPAMKKASAIITDEGGITSHAAIVSREMGIPCIVGTERASQILRDGDLITVDASSGKVYRGNLTEAIKEEEKKVEEKKEEEVSIENIKTETKIYMNLGIPEKIQDYKNLPIDGVGLMRIEFIIANSIREHPLHMIEQNRQQEYINKLSEGIMEVASTINPKPVIVRFSDFKTNEYRNLEGGEKYEPKEENPMMGWRGASRYISEKFEEAFRLECRAIRRVREDCKNVWVMIPFIRTPEEAKKCMKIMESEGLIRSESFKVWIMAEVPSIAIIAEDFAQLNIDGASIGSNDLTQLVLGVDRDSEILGKMGYFDEREKSVLKAVKRIISKFQKHGKKVSLCGQAPSVHPEFAEFLVLSGIDSISVSADVVEKTKRIVHEAEKKRKFLEIAFD